MSYPCLRAGRADAHAALPHVLEHPADLVTCVSDVGVTKSPAFLFVFRVKARRPGLLSSETGCRTSSLGTFHRCTRLPQDFGPPSQPQGVPVTGIPSQSHSEPGMSAGQWSHSLGSRVGVGWTRGGRRAGVPGPAWERAPGLAPVPVSTACEGPGLGIWEFGSRVLLRKSRCAVVKPGARGRASPASPDGPRWK